MALIIFLNKFRILEEQYRNLKERFENLETRADALPYQNPYLANFITSNKQRIETNLERIQDDILALEQGEILSTAKQYAKKLESLDVTTREFYYDTLYQAITQRQDPELQQKLLAADNLLKEVFNDIGRIDKPLIITFSSEFFPGYVYRISKKIGIPFSATDDISYFSIVAHEAAHEALGNFSASLQVLLIITMVAREEFSRRYGIKRTAFDKFIEAIDTIPLRRQAFIDDMKKYLTTHSDLIPLNFFIGPYEDFEEQLKVSQALVNRVKHFLSEIKGYISDIEDFFELKKANIEWIGEIVGDIIEIKLMGPFSFKTSLKISKIDYSKFNWTETHPPDTFRLFFMKEILDSNNLGGVIEKEWNEWVNGLPNEVREEFDQNKEYLRRILNFIDDYMGKEGYPRRVFTKDDYIKSIKVSKKLVNGETIEQEKASVILNATQIAIENGADKSDINKLAIASLSKRSI
jgi:hypothetical protein